MAKKYGNQKPTQSVILKYTKKNSKAKEAIALYEKTGLSCYKWQENLLQPIMAVDKKGKWIHQKFGYAIPRRNGKSEILYMLELWGLHQGLNILHTAHRISTSHSSFEKLKRYLEKMGYVDRDDFNSVRAKGQERIELYKTGGVIQFRTRTSSGGLGEGFDLMIIDEAQEYTNEQESALKYTVTDSLNPMTVMCGTPPTPVSVGTVFTKYRETCLFGNGKHFGWAEWSVDTEREITDVSSWYVANPSLGYHLDERKIEAELGADKLDHNIQRLGFWVKYNQKSAISETEWLSLKAEQLPNFSDKLYVGVKYGQDGTNVAVSIATKTGEGKIFVETIDCQPVRNGNDWIIQFLQQARAIAVVIDGANGQNILYDEMKQNKIKKAILPTVKEIITANALWEKGIYQKTICHMAQPSLVKVVSNCDKRNIGSNGGFGYRSHYEDVDICLMDSALLAHWACATAKPKTKQQFRY